MLNIEIDKKSGFCFGVVKAITKAEEELAKGETLYCLGDIVHNGQEVERLTKMGLITIDHEQFALLHDAKVLLRAHGEPPKTYDIAKENNLTLIDASCPVVLKLQNRIKKAYQNAPSPDTQIVIYGEKGHAEVNGLVGQTDEKAIVIESEADLDKLDFNKKIQLFSQTTKSLEGFNELVITLSKKVQNNDNFEFFDTICRQVANRIPNITTFASQNDIVIFVSGKKSSNGKVLYQHSKKINPNTYLVTEANEVTGLDLDLTKQIGICGATSTPRWLMEEVADKLKEMSLSLERI
ncbi:hydroxymethylbutenyl pyrophosphate reductase [Paludibacter propionicigenes WB4]|uniref:4-hydroxy-3-methylbut-2-enyl diphosphate reductase n=1 Tax=Paludibacter propionicigenes (strain DSM 17365 / JCM 13257 / WB4) TaxID=694427 RepID=E4T882_PALPW|nr:4-hydroxy-3-methylbut-2-enyl diphosphate reductase [Paludibacter propionicigenes]ADQ80926.1 hydroxymethylbutenyl pyrophosphate reductase [Paludibacter propionicigenes WB4]